MTINYFTIQDKHLLIFGLVAGVEIYEVKQSGAKKVFNKMCNHKIDENNDLIPVQLDCAEHRVRPGILQIVIATESSRINKSEDHDNFIICLEVDIQNGFKVFEIF